MPVLDRMNMDTLIFTDNPAALGRPGHYKEITVNIAKIMESWRASLYAFEWVLPDGRIKTLPELPETEQSKRRAVEEKLQNGQPLEKPVLGIGLLENVEIGSGRATLLTLAAHGIETMPVHVPLSSEDEFVLFLA